MRCRPVPSGPAGVVSGSSRGVFRILIRDGTFGLPVSRRRLPERLAADARAALPPATSAAAVLAYAPGRVTLVGEHVDHAGGPVLACALDFGLAVAIAPAGASAASSRGTSDLLGDAALDDAGDGPDWLRAIDAVRRTVTPDLGPIDVAVASDIPVGAGLGSSGALLVASTLACTDLARDPVPPAIELARTAMQVEHDVLGVPCGILDPLVSVAARPGKFLWLDAASGSHRAFRSRAHRRTDDVILVVDSTTRHRHADGRYAVRRDEIDAAATALDVDSWPMFAMRRAATSVLDVLPEPQDRRARHVVNEIRRVDAATRCLEAGRLADVGVHLDATHTSLRDDLEVSIPEIECLRSVVRASLGPGRGCRMVGGGFGGSLISTGPRAEIMTAIPTIVRRARAALGRPVSASIAVPGEGARRIPATRAASIPVG